MVMANVDNLMGDDDVVLSIHGHLDVVVDHSGTPATGRDRPRIRIGQGEMLVRRFLQLGFDAVQLLHLLFKFGNLFL